MTQRLVAIVGATATGKTPLAIALAQRIGGEIVNADSRQPYRGMDIGTAKPSPEDRAAARHWLVDVADPDEQFTLASFLDLAHEAISDIMSRDLTPIVAGGTGQYVWALLEGWQIPRVPPDHSLRTELEALAARDGAAAVAGILSDVDPASASTINPANVRRMIRAIEVTRATGRPFSDWSRRAAASYISTILGLTLPREQLYRRIDTRVDAMIAAGLVDEVDRLNAAGYSCDLPSMNSIGYRQMCDYRRGACTLEDAIGRIKTETHRLARVQHTWFSATDPRIHWLPADAPDLVERALAIASI